MVVLYPPTDFRTVLGEGKVLPRDEPAPSKEYDSGMPLTQGMVKLCDQAYILDSTNREDPKLSVILRKAENFPKKAWIAIGEADILFVSLSFEGDG